MCFIETKRTFCCDTQMSIFYFRLSWSFNFCNSSSTRSLLLCFTSPLTPLYFILALPVVLVDVVVVDVVRARWSWLLLVFDRSLEVTLFSLLKRCLSCSATALSKSLFNVFICVCNNGNMIINITSILFNNYYCQLRVEELHTITVYTCNIDTSTTLIRAFKPCIASILASRSCRSSVE
jgi:hypothetical protein